MIKKSREKNRKNDWTSFYKNKSNQVPRDTLLKVLELFESEKKQGTDLFAIDIGCGHGADTLELLKRNWKVLAIDNNPEGLKLLEESVLPDWKMNLQTRKQAFESMQFEKCNLINASYSIPFCKPEYFMKLWNEIVKSIRTGGRFSGNFFGVNDSWSDNKSMTFLKKEVVKNLFVKFEIELFQERDEDGATASGEAKHWHVFSVIARRKDSPMKNSLNAIIVEAIK